MNTWLQIISIPCLMTLIVRFGIEPLAHRLKIKLFKPINCAFCLTFWTSGLIFVYLYGWQGLLMCAVSTIAAGYIERI